MLRAHLEDGCPLARVAGEHGVPERTLRRWLAAYRAGGLAALARRPRSDRGTRRMPPELQLLIEGLALRRPPPTIATVHRQAAQVARDQGWPVAGYGVVQSIDPAMATLAHEGSERYKEVFDLVHRREAAKPNQIWQADHTLLDLWVLTPSGRPGRPWLTLIEDDHSRAVAGYAVNLGAPSALTTALAFRQAIWRKPWPGWHVCGIPEAFHVDHGSDFISAHLEQVMADLKIRAYFSLPGQPRGRGKVERAFGTINQMCLPSLPGYAPRGTPDRAGQARLTLAELDTAIGTFIRPRAGRAPAAGEPGRAGAARRGFWHRTPTEAELAGMWPGITAGEFGDLAGLVDLAVGAGFRPAWIETATVEEWEDFESGYQCDEEEWLAAHPGHPRAAEIRERVDQHRSFWLRGYYGLLGLAYLTLVPVG